MNLSKEEKAFVVAAIQVRRENEEAENRKLNTKTSKPPKRRR